MKTDTVQVWYTARCEREHPIYFRAVYRPRAGDLIWCVKCAKTIEVISCVRGKLDA